LVRVYQSIFSVAHLAVRIHKLSQGGN